MLVNHWPLTPLPTRVLRHPEFSIWCGTTASADWHVRYRATAVVYGHLHIPRVTVEDGVRFVEASLGYPREWQARERRYAHGGQCAPPAPGPPSARRPTGSRRPGCLPALISPTTSQIPGPLPNRMAVASQPSRHSRPDTTQPISQIPNSTSRRRMMRLCTTYSGSCRSVTTTGARRRWNTPKTLRPLPGDRPRPHPASFVGTSHPW